jgi:hypothetical protein
MHSALRTLPCYLIVLALTGSTASATTIDPLLFEELVLGADFVGIVECEQAGGIVAAYRVIESWKGPKPGTRINIRVAVNYWEPQFPITLCGERYFVTAFKEPPSRVMSTTSGGPVPLWWRKIPADYGLPLFQGRNLLAPGEENGATFQKTRKAAQDLLALKPVDREATLLTAVIEKELSGRNRDEGEPHRMESKAIQARLAKMTTVETLVAELVRIASEQPQDLGPITLNVLMKAGGAVTLASVSRLPSDRLPWSKEEFAFLVKAINRRLDVKAASDEPEELGPERTPSAPELEDLRQTLRRGAEDRGFGAAITTLTRHDPISVVQFLVTWRNPSRGWLDQDRGYALGSYFACRCGKDRRKHLASLATADDPYIRVAGAVYLCFEDTEAGTKALERTTTLDGDAGVWAALTLARRGHKGAVPRALEVFRIHEPYSRMPMGTMGGVPHGNLQKRVLVLLSNSAWASGVPQPVPPGQQQPSFATLHAWWEQHNDRLRINDPWLGTLEQQKVD